MGTRKPERELQLTPFYGVLSWVNQLYYVLSYIFLIETKPFINLAANCSRCSTWFIARGCILRLPNRPEGIMSFLIVQVILFQPLYLSWLANILESQGNGQLLAQALVMRLGGSKLNATIYIK